MTLQLTEKVRGGFAGLGDVAKTTALPKENRPLRLPTYPNLERTCVLALERTANVTVGDAGAADFITRASLTRSPAVPLWYDQSIVATDYMACTDVSSFDAGDLEDSLPFFAASTKCVFAHALGYQWLLSPYRTDSFTGPNIFGYSNQTLSVQIEYTFDGRQMYQAYEDLTATVSKLIAVPCGAWFRVAAVSNVPLGLMRLSFQLAVNGRYLLPAGEPIQSTYSTLMYNDVRMTSNAALFTNVTKVLNKEGTVRCARFVPSAERNNVFPWYWNDSEISSVHPAERYFGALEKGAYSFTANSAESVAFDRAYINLTLQTSWPDGLSASTYNFPSVAIRDVSVFNAMQFFDGDAGTELAMTNNVHLEFRTESSLFNIGYSTMPLEQYHAAQVALLGIGFFFENDSHWTDVARFIIRGLTKVIPMVAPQFGAAVRIAGRAGEIILDRLSAKKQKDHFTQKQLTAPGKNKQTRRKREKKPKQQGKKKKQR
jgi:hypothetical protein